MKNNQNNLSESEPMPAEVQTASMVSGIWTNNLIISPNNFIHKSLSNFAVNIAVGCIHGCRFCYVPDTSTIKQGSKLAQYGVEDPDEDWGKYSLFRKWDEKAFLNSLLMAELQSDLKPDGNRAIMFCTTTDPYQVIIGVPKQKQINKYAAFLMRRSLELIRDCSSLNVRILTRGPLAKRDFDLFKSFGNRLTFGMSLPTLDEKLCKIYEPYAPGVTKRLETLKAAKSAGLHVYVAIAPTFPECDAADIRRTLEAVKALDPITIFQEPINIRAENVVRIEKHAVEHGVSVKSEVFATPTSWRKYAIESLMLVHSIAEELEIVERLKLWPDAGLVAKGEFLKIRNSEFERLNPGAALTKQQREVKNRLDLEEFERFKAWIQRWWDKVSEWPGIEPQTGWEPPLMLTRSPFEPVTLEAIRDLAPAPAAADPAEEKTKTNKQPKAAKPVKLVDQIVEG